MISIKVNKRTGNVFTEFPPRHSFRLS